MRTVERTYRLVIENGTHRIEEDYETQEECITAAQQHSGADLVYFYAVITTTTTTTTTTEGLIHVLHRGKE